jgi:hypothetical protein
MVRLRLRAPPQCFLVPEDPGSRDGRPEGEGEEQARIEPASLVHVRRIFLSEWEESSVVSLTSLQTTITMIAMMDMMRMTTEPKNVYPLAELSILELVFALTIPSPSILEGLTGMWQVLPGL